MTKHSKVGGLMTGEVVSVVPSTPFKEVAKRLAEHDISGLPVLDEDDRVVGVVSETDLLVRQALAADAVCGTRRPGPGAGTPGRDEGDAITAGRLMSAPAVTVHADETVAAAARTMLRRCVDRLPVVDDEDRLVGIVTRRDLLVVFLRPDPEIRRRVVEEVLVDTMGLAPDAVDVHVVDGRVTLEGTLETPAQILIVKKLTEQTDGVVSVSDRLTARGGDSP
ncbi:CBS domain-containing protein [Streptomyces sp. HNM0645]|uniref:CBS domain-containing protein n=1 Tax=Streptomyces sp. HNM0645 TaxID=2782343 RepID=UPI0024B6D632|nr:CBS domain-containing protein [Streptomyces sp. HNM0645]MDI9885121.1 CBS domain-containing protein [Streptomyces sp. HNM0645]